MEATPSDRDESFPLEVVHEILQHVSRSELHRLALVDRKYQAEAERLLYWSVTLDDMHNRYWDHSCLKTIATVPHKAVLVRSLVVCWRAEKSNSMLRTLGQCLLGLTSLKDLRLHFQSTRLEIIPHIIVPFLKQCTFSITTLFISDHMELSSWVPNQKELRTIGVYTSLKHPSPENLSLYQQLLENSPTSDSLTLFCLSCHGTWLDTVYAFPKFSHHWSAKPIQVSLDVQHIRIFRFRILITNLSDESVLRPAMTSISEHFPEVRELRLIVNNPNIHLKPDVVTSSLSLMPNLQKLFVDYLGVDGKKTASPYQANRVGLAKSWTAKCPTLRYIIFPDSTSWPGGNVEPER